MFVAKKAENNFSNGQRHENEKKKKAQRIRGVQNHIKIAFQCFWIRIPCTPIHVHPIWAYENWRRKMDRNDANQLAQNCITYS